MANVDFTYVRKEMVAAREAPSNAKGIGHWLKVNLFATPRDIIFSILAIALLAYILPSIFRFVFIDAVWTGENRTACTTVSQGGALPDGQYGACWAFVSAKFEQFIFGRYPLEERWRPITVMVAFTLLLIPMLIPKAPFKGWNALALFIVLPTVSFFLLTGGFGLPYVETQLWGGLMVTLVLSFFGITVSLPFGILLALGRRSNLPAIKMLCILFIEVVRGIPLITVLFFASVMLPLFLPDGWTFDKLLRALIGVSIFASAYMAEVVRGGLQAMPRGQYEGADSLGLSYWQKTRLVILPQALKLVIPGIVNTFIGLFKDTSLVSIIGMFDLLGIVTLNQSDANWATPVTPVTGYLFAGFVFWIFCFGMSRYSLFMERHLDTGHKR
ncbi:amino acid ABC transporter permease [Rhizobium sp. Root149]|jgi:general L-amino acid transport system permease protein|uniref:General L-amino acid transport system permease protein n=1 Tax=Rhizobium rhizoryzae TaxID=451876 RepID=A0A7W6LD06_9HYPH|nr:MULTISPECIES: amino acid ABC transporter permease [Rhizobium]KQZ54913.1 amino acid ABC transporter permease [Rhizobium sp. Root149]MBB4142038.1 general L-amino acid transport system permease protein [Rhizobium rhizoryzae]